MHQKELLSISQFAKMADITRANLIFYDKENILTPTFRSQGNGYRYYSFQQLNQAFTINHLRKIGLSLKAIKKFYQNNSLEEAANMAEQQNRLIQKQISELKQLQAHLDTFQKNLSELAQLKFPAYQIQKLSAKYLTLSPPYQNIREKTQSMYDFFRYCKENDIDYHGYLGRLFLKDKIQTSNFYEPSYLYFENMEGEYEMSAGNYFIYYDYSDGSNLSAIYQKVQSLLKEKG
ncbi:multidrug-efflux transporter 2 regulator [Streptococcus troglodytae]|uniref:Multidrug-efflux transporter 2 regulator n=1 Tax=Streptococcus troglodytae TaxID=1111760 RepID=A0A1L7LK55_9STRE|nr:MerR family transcriptional regulator [Streptococcus troglodytae]BAQ24498.1 multidrug-efflux transporter 2 regulator [Streptococcus troglodytae]